MVKPVILTGIRSNAELTLGNYIGAMQPLAALQSKYAEQYQINMFVPDLHSFTTPIDHAILYQSTIRNLKYFIAGGLNINSDSTYIYRQSYISAHSELAWILSCFIYIGELSRMTQYKEKSQNKVSVSAGLFNYPVLMAADILLYGAKYIPVGEDQRQHLELARDCAIRMNNQFKQPLFIVPEIWEEQLKFTNSNQGLRIRSLKHPESKMSKSIIDPSGTILLTDTPAEGAKKILSATTDSLANIAYNYKNQPGISNLLQINSSLSGQPLNSLLELWQDKSSYGDLKKATADLVYSFLEDFQLKVSQVNEAELIESLETDERYIRDLANTKLAQVQQAIGLRQS